MKTTLKLVFIYLGYQLLSGAAMTIANMLWPFDATTQVVWALLLSSLAMTVHLISFGYIHISQAIRPVTIPILLCSLVYTMGGVLCCNGLSGLIPLPDWMESNFTALSHNFLGVFCMAFLAPLLEELLFRGAIMQSLNRPGDSPWRSILLSAAIFGLIHRNPAQIPYAFLMGIVFGWVTWRTGSLLPAIAGHILNNSLSVMEMLNKDTSLVQSDDLPNSILLTMVFAGLALTLLTSQILIRLTPSQKVTHNI